MATVLNSIGGIMTLTTKEKIVVFAHEHDPIQPRHIEAMGLSSMNTLEHLMPEMVKEKLLKRITCERGKLTDR